MKQWTKIAGRVLILFLGFTVTIILPLVLIHLLVPYLPYGFSVTLPQQEQQQRTALIEKAREHLGVTEGSPGHRAIIDSYNAHEPLAQGYAVQYTDNWCAAFVSYAAIKSGQTDIIPTECGCERQIGLWQQKNRWQESDTHLPLPGDIIYYDWDANILGDSTGWSDHVGIVVGTWGPFIKVIEGNKDDCVCYRHIPRWDPRIRGYGLPEY